MKKKIVIVIPSLSGGGAERVMLNIAQYLDREKYELSVILINNRGEYINQLPDNTEIVNLGSKRVRNSIFKLIIKLNELKPDIIFSTLAYLNILLLLIRPFLIGKPKILIREANTPSIASDISKCRKILRSAIFSTADKIIVQCDEMKKDFLDFYSINENKVVRIYNPVDRKEIIQRANAFNPYNEATINLLAVGRLVEQKSFDTLLKSVSIIKKEIPNIHLTILGQGELYKELNELALTLQISDNVSFLGFVNNPYPYYKYADVFVLSSKWEGFPNSLLEAITFGTTVVSTKCKSGPKEILEEGKLGTLVEIEDVQGLSKAIINSIHQNNEIKLMKKSECYSIEKIMLEYDSLFSEIL